MKLGLLGSGKTGSKVVELANDPVMVFNSRNIPTLEKLKELDVLISFVPGHVFLEYLPLLLEAKVPVVTGSTGFSWPENTQSKLEQAGLTWVHANNFSLGMNIVRMMIENLSLATKLFDQYHCSIHEIHHTKKLDAPSGTALSWQDWFGHPCTITAAREGDVVGFHEMTFDTPQETIKLTHDAKNRAIFAEGAMWAAKILHHNKNLNSGLIHFNQVIKDYLFQRSTT
jgi:4-hydroxy-tetrahydrodipicolinate reductase